MIGTPGPIVTSPDVRTTYHLVAIDVYHLVCAKVEMPNSKSDWLKNSLREFATEVPARRAKCQNESQTRSYLIDPFLCCIGWNTHDPSQVFVEFTPNFAKTRETVDYALLQEDQPIILIEAKSVGNKVPPEAPNQLQRYVVFTGSCQIAAWTNGTIWCWYRRNPKDRSLLPKPFLKFDLADTNFPSDLALRWIEVLKSHPMDLKVLDSISREIAKAYAETIVKPQTRILDAPLGEDIEMLQQKSGRIVSDSGWHLTENLAPKLVAFIEENGTPSQKRVFKPESGLDLGQAQDLIKEVLEKKHGKVSDSPFIPGFPPASEKPPQGKGWTLSRVRLPVEVIDRQ